MGKKKGELLNAYLSLQVITVSSVSGMDSDWLMGERGNQKGKVPITYLELLNWTPPTPLSLQQCHIYIVLQWQASLLPLHSHSQMLSLFFQCLRQNEGGGPGVLNLMQHTSSSPLPPLWVQPCNLQHVPELLPNLELNVYAISIGWWLKSFWCYSSTFK